MRAFLVFVDVWPTPAVRAPSFQFGGLLRKFSAMSDQEFSELINKRPLKVWATGCFVLKIERKTPRSLKLTKITKLPITQNRNILMFNTS